MSNLQTMSPIAPPKRSAVEKVKEESNQLRGTIAEELQQDSDHFIEANRQLIKFHGSYQQEDRDARKNRSKAGVGKHYFFMVRCKIPGGRLTAEQYLAVDEISGKYASGTLRITSRQGIQLHGVLKTHLKDTIAGINHCLLTTLGACGDVNRNVMVSPAPLARGVHSHLYEIGKFLAGHFAPRSGAYHEVWLNGKAMHPATATPEEIEPIYGKVYLPRKFKIGLALPDNNLIDVYGQDLGLLGIVENEKIVGFNVLAGGGMGRTPGNANTFAYLARPICYVPVEDVVPAAEAVIKIFRDHGNRENRKHARLKYLVRDWGPEKFRAVMSEYMGRPLPPPRDVEVQAFDLHLGWHPQGDGKYWYGIHIENGRIKDEGPLQLRTALRQIISQYKPDIRNTPMQDILLCNLEESARAGIEKILRDHGVLAPSRLSLVQTHSMACPAIPTCGLAISESERIMPQLIDNLETILNDLGLADEKITVRMTGCPNGCVRPYQSDIGIVGRSGEKYSVFVGGHILGHRLNFLIQDLVPLQEIVPLLTALLRHYKEQRQPGENFGDWCHRLGAERLHLQIPEELRRPLPKEALECGEEE